MTPSETFTKSVPDFHKFVMRANNQINSDLHLSADALSMTAAAARRKQDVPKDQATKKAKTKQAKPKADGLWVDWDFLRSLTKRPPQTVLHDEGSPGYNRFLRLADIALGSRAKRRKVEKRAVAFPKGPKSRKRWKEPDRRI